MARFKYIGEPNFSFVTTIGNCTVIAVPRGDGTVQTVDPPGGAPSFTLDADIGVDITDWYSLIAMRNNPRYQEIP